jgi:hypothetical protein
LVIRGFGGSRKNSAALTSSGGNGNKSGLPMSDGVPTSSGGNGNKRGLIKNLGLSQKLPEWQYAFFLFLGETPRESEAKSARFHGRRVTKVGPEVKHGLIRVAGYAYVERNQEFVPNYGS